MSDSITSQASNPIGSKVPVSSSIMYDNPFFDMTSFYMPKSIKSLFRYVNATLYSDPIVSQVITKLSEYPITNIIYNDTTGSIKPAVVEDRWKEILEDNMGIDNAMKTCGMDYYGYGTSLVSINYPFKRMLKCPKCKNEKSVESSKTKYKNHKFMSTCKCGYSGKMEARDMPTKEIEKLGFVFWDLMNIHIKYNNISGDHFFYYTIPNNIRKSINNGDMDIINTTRLEVIKAVEKNKKLKLSPQNLFHYKRPGPQYIYPDQRGWGVSVIMPVLKDIFYKRILRKGNEAIAFEHIVPLRIIFPQGTGEVSPHSMTNLGTWKSKIEDEILMWKKDPNRISIVPLPVGQINFGGDGKMLLVTNEIKAVDDDIIIGTGIIPEIIKGGASWSGSNVSLRVVENTFLNHRKSMKSFIKWTTRKVALYMGLPEIDVDMDDFKMADDLQRKQLLLKAAGESQISFDTAIKEFGLNPDSEYKKMIEEVKRQTEILTLKAEGQAEAQGAGGIISGMYGADAQFESQSRMEKNMREKQERDDKQKQQGLEERANISKEEAGRLAQSQGVNPETVNTADLILIMTRRFARLSKSDPEEFKIRMLSMKNSMPILYKEVYENLSEMNLIEADLNPDLAMAQKHTPGELPKYIQGDSAASNPPQPAEQGTSPNALDKDSVKPLPEVLPPRGANASI